MRTVSIARTVITTVTIPADDPDLLLAIRRMAGAPEGIEVNFDAGYDSLREITLSWAETESE